jgi:hypothetical protein
VASPDDHEQRFARFDFNPPADPAAIQRFEAGSQVRLPDDYVEFLRTANGGEGMVGNAYLSLWRIEELIQRNEDCEVAETVPGLFLFGSDGGGEAFAFDMRSGAKPIVMVPFIILCFEDAIPMGGNFEAFLVELNRYADACERKAIEPHSVTLKTDNKRSGNN